jgi:hypothetical protein
MNGDCEINADSNKFDCQQRREPSVYIILKRKVSAVVLFIGPIVLRSGESMYIQMASINYILNCSKCSSAHAHIIVIDHTSTLF